jgi:hypothetical protein
MRTLRNGFRQVLRGGDDDFSPFRNIQRAFEFDVTVSVDANSLRLHDDLIAMNDQPFAFSTCIK